MQVKMVVLVSRMDRVEFAVYIFLPGSSVLVESAARCGHGEMLGCLVLCQFVAYQTQGADFNGRYSRREHGPISSLVLGQAM